MASDTEADCGTAERDEWSSAPAVGVGPLRFGMTVGQVVEAAQVLGEAGVGDCPQDHAIFSPTWKIEVHRRRVAPGPPAVTACASRAAGLFCVAVDAVQGPQVAYDGIPLVGRDMTELEGDAIAYAERGTCTSATRPTATRHRTVPGSSCAANWSGRSCGRDRCSWWPATARTPHGTRCPPRDTMPDAHRGVPRPRTAHGPTWCDPCPSDPPSVRRPAARTNWMRGFPDAVGGGRGKSGCHGYR